MKAELSFLSIKELSQGLQNKDFTAVELTEHFLARIKSEDSRFNSFINVCEKEALLQATQADKDIQSGNCKSLSGIPMGVKDIFLVKGLESTCASKILKGYKPQYTASCIQNLLDHGSVIVGKNNMDEFAMGSTTENSSYFNSKNPWNTDHIPGGSSGGSAAAVAAGLVPVSIGTDTGGSVRQPAACCGVVGLKPTYGRVSRSGVTAFASSLDQAGPITRTVEDAALVLQSLVGFDSKDSTSFEGDKQIFTSSLGSSLKGKCIGIPTEFFDDGLNKEVLKAIEEAKSVFKDAGVKFKEVSIPLLKYSISAYYLIATAEASSNLSRFDGLRYGPRAQADSLINSYYNTRGEGFGKEVKRRILLGTFALSSGYYEAYYKKASQVRALLKNQYEEVMNECDILLSPTMPTTAFKLGEKIDDPLQMYLSDIYTICANLVGAPAVSIPCGFDSNNLPIGMQLLGKHFQESDLLSFAHCYEVNTKWSQKRP